MDLVFTVAKELHERAFPELLRQDLPALLEALHGFVYGPADSVTGLHVCTCQFDPETCTAEHHRADYGRTGPSVIDESRPAADPLRRFERLQELEPPDQPPACEAHPENRLECLACGEIRRAFYVELGRRMAEGPCAGGRCVDPEAHAEGAHDL